MSKLKSVVTKVAGLVARSVMRCGRMMMSRRARLDALSAAIEWFVKRNGYKPLEFSHASGYGNFDVMSDGKQIQLTWWLQDPEKQCGNEHDSDHDDSSGTTHSVIDASSGDSIRKDIPCTSYPVGDIAQTVCSEFDSSPPSGGKPNRRGEP